MVKAAVSVGDHTLNCIRLTGHHILNWIHLAFMVKKVLLAVSGLKLLES